MLVLDTGGVIRGNLAAAGTMKLDCWLEGDVVCSRLEIGKDGFVLGNVTARELVVAGQIVGRVDAASVRLDAGAFVEGDVRHTTLTVDASATLIGQAVKSRDFSPRALMEIEARAAADKRQLEGECRANTRIAHADWASYQGSGTVTPFRGGRR